MKSDQTLLLLSASLATFVFSLFLSLVSVHTYCENRTIAGIFVISAVTLFNLTVGEVIWHHGGGMTIQRCPETVRSCWSKWWLEQKDKFKVGVGGDRDYTNCPNYGIYEQFADYSPR